MNSYFPLRINLYIYKNFGNIIIMKFRLIASSLILAFFLFSSPLLGQLPFVGGKSESEHPKTENTDAKKDSIRKADSLKIIELTQKIQQMEFTQISYLNELEKNKATVANDSLSKAKYKAKIDSLRRHSIGTPLIIDGDTLLTLYAPKGGISVQERIKQSIENIIELADKRSTKPDSIRLLPLEHVTEIMYKDKVIISITEDDALWMGTDIDSLAKTSRKAIVEEVVKIQKKNSILVLVKRIFQFLLVLVIQYLLFYGMNILFKRLKRRIIYKSFKTFKSIRIKDYEFLNTNRQARILIFSINILRYALIILQLLFSIPILFSIFPQTQDLAHKLFGYLLAPIKDVFSSIVTYIPNLFFIAVIWLSIRWVVRGIKYIADEIEAERLKISGFFPDWAQPSYSIVRFLLYAFMLAMIYPYLPGSDSGVFQGISVLVGLVVSLGSSTVIANIIAGFVITYMRPFKLGDRIKLNETVGNVIEKTPFVTRIKTPKNEVVTIPNSFIMSSHTINYSASARDYGLIIHSSLSVGYDVPWQAVHHVLITAAKATPGVDLSKDPFVLELTIHDFYVIYEINAYITDANKLAQIYSDLHSSIQTEFLRAHINLESPILYAKRDPDILPDFSDYIKKGLL